ILVKHDDQVRTLLPLGIRGHLGKDSGLKRRPIFTLGFLSQREATRLVESRLSDSLQHREEFVVQKDVDLTIVGTGLDGQIQSGSIPLVREDRSFKSLSKNW